MAKKDEEPTEEELKDFAGEIAKALIDAGCDPKALLAYIEEEMKKPESQRWRGR